MNKQLPVLYKENFFKKLINKIKLFFVSKNNCESNNITNIEPTHDIDMNNIKLIEKNDIRNTFMNDIKVEKMSKSKEEKIKQLLKELKENPERLKEFSVDNLEKILEWYKEDNKNKLRQLGRFLLTLFYKI